MNPQCALTVGKTEACGPAEFVLFAEEYYETELDLDLVESVFAGATITDEMILALNPNQNLVQVRKRLSALE